MKSPNITDGPEASLNTLPMKIKLTSISLVVDVGDGSGSRRADITWEGHEKGRSKLVAGGEPRCMIYNAVQDYRDRTALKRRAGSIGRWHMRPMRHYGPYRSIVAMAVKLFDDAFIYNSLKTETQPN